MSTTLFLYLAGSYLLGSIPFGLWIALWWKGVDVRTQGSGNIGATNVARVCGPAAGRAVLALDLLKGFVPPVIGQYALHLLQPDSRWIVLSALLAILGHNFSIFLGFKGGKGISTSGGALFGASPKAGLGSAVVFFLVFAGTSTVSVASLAAAVALPFMMALLYPGDRFQLAFGIAASLMAFFKHRKNIDRIRKGTEPKSNLFARREKPAPTTPPDDAVAVASEVEKDAAVDASR